jgi:hypothetical protein
MPRAFCLRGGKMAVANFPTAHILFSSQRQVKLSALGAASVNQSAFRIIG